MKRIKEMKGSVWFLCTWLLLAAMVSGSGVFAQTVYGKNDDNASKLLIDLGDAQTIQSYEEETLSPETRISSKKIVSTDLDLPQKWTVEINGKMISTVLTDKRSEMAEMPVAMMLLNSNETNYNNFLNNAAVKLNQGKGTMSMDLSFLSEGDYKIVLWEQLTNSDLAGCLGEYKIYVGSESVDFINPGPASVEKSFLSEVQSKYSPTLYNSLTYSDYKNISNLNEIIDASDAMAGNATDKTAIAVAIHEALCKSWNVDNDNLDIDNDKNASKPQWVYPNFRGNSRGLSALYQTMLRQQGIPCLMVEGYVNNMGLGDNVESLTQPNSVWNLVYLNNAWKIVDVTWNDANLVYDEAGENASEDLVDNLCYYCYFGIDPEEFALTHHSLRVVAEEGITGLEIGKQPETRVFTQGGTFTFDGTLYLVDSKEKKYAISGSDSHIKYSGYNLSKLGVQTVKISYYDLEAEYNIEVKPPAADQDEITGISFKKSPATTVFEKGEAFVFDGEVQYTNNKNETHPILADDANLSITGYRMNEIGEQTITVQYYDFKLQYTIEILDSDITGACISGDSKVVKPGEGISIPVTITNNTGMMGFGIEIVYDADVLSPSGVTKGALLSSGTFNDSLASSEPGSFKVIWSNTDEITADGELFTVAFSQNDATATGTTAIQLNVSAEDTFDESFDEVDIKGKPVLITIMTQEEQNALSEQISSAVGELDGFAKDVTDYDEAGKSEIAVIVEKAKAKVEKAISQAEVTAILDQAKAEIARVSKKQNGQSDSANNLQFTYTANEDGTITITGLTSANVTNLIIPDKIDGKTVTGIGKAAFMNNNTIQAVSIPATVKKIDSHAFSGCRALTTVVLPDSLTSMGTYVFSDCVSLRSAVLNTGRITIPEGTFNNCISLSSVTIKEALETIGSKAFANCTALTRMALPASIKKIEANAFSGANIKNIIYAGTKKDWGAINIAEAGNGGFISASVLDKDAKIFKASFKGDPQVKAPDKVNLKKVKYVSKKKSITAKWKATAATEGYEIQIASDKKFKKNKKLYTTEINSKTIFLTKKQLKKFKTKKCFVRVRAYALDGNNKVYGTWSKVKTIKIK